MILLCVLIVLFYVVELFILLKLLFIMYVIEIKFLCFESSKPYVLTKSINGSDYII